MTNSSQAPDLLESEPQQRVRTETLNVVSILTFIGCGLGLLGSVYAFFSAAQSYQKILDAQANLNDASPYAKALIGPAAVEAARRSLEYRTPILLLSLVALSLCTWGAIQMRSLKKKGFYFYLVGEVMPFITIALTKPSGIMGDITIGVSIVISGVFIALYGSQLRNMD